MIRNAAIALALAFLATSATVKPAEAQWWRIASYVGAGWLANNIWHHGMGPHGGYGYNWGPRYGGYGPPPGYYGGPPPWAYRHRYAYGGW